MRGPVNFDCVLSDLRSFVVAELPSLMYPKWPAVFGSEDEMNGEIALRPPPPCWSVIVELELSVPFCNEPSDLSAWWELLLRSRTGIGTGSSFGWLLAKKLALEAVMGVLGIPFGPALGGGVIDPESRLAEPSYKAAILAAVGVLNGSRFIGGNLKG